MLVFDIYTNTPNKNNSWYKYYEGEGSFRVYLEKGELMLINKPNGN